MDGAWPKAPGSSDVRGRVRDEPYRSSNPREVAPVHVVTDDEVLARPGFALVARWLLEAGGADVALHLRGPTSGGRLLYELACELVPVAEGSGAAVIVNDRIDVALAARAHGVQLGQRSLSLAKARSVARGRGRLQLGVSVHGPDEARAAGDADWWLVGTLWPTPSHPGHPGDGPGRLSELAAGGRVPCIGIGGVDLERVADVRAAGGAGIAVLGGIWRAADPVVALHSLVERWHSS